MPARIHEPCPKKQARPGEPRTLLRRIFISCVWLLGLASLSTAGHAQEALRPRIGLVLSGGGARGIAHVGVLKALDQMHIPVDAIAGTSMGAVVGGLYASGMSAEQIEQLLKSVNWQDAFRDTPPRADLGFRRKQDDRNFLVRYALGVQHRDVLLPRGLVQGQKLSQILRGALLPVADVNDFDRLPIPFRAMATDLETGAPVVMASGDLASAMRASMSAPGIFAPAERDGRLLVDGGLVANLPVDIARSMNVDVLIVVDVSFPLGTRDDLTSPLEITNQAFAIMVRARTAEALAKLSDKDILIQPALGHASSVDFGRVAATLSAGERGAAEARAALAKFSLDAAGWEIYLAGRNPRTDTAPRVAFVRVDEASKRYERLVTSTMKEAVGQPLDRDVIQARLSSLYALDLFESIDYALVDDDGQQGLEFKLKRKSWGPNYVRVGLNIEDDFEGNSRYNAAARFIMTELNSLGGEWLTDVQIGDNPRFFTEFYQPISDARRYFIAPQFDFEIKNVFALDANERRIAEYRVHSYEGGVDVGRELGDWGEMRGGLRRGSGRTSILVGNPELPATYFDTGGFFYRFSYDKLDSIYFPRHGQQFEMQWRGERLSMGAEQNVDIVSATWLVARSLGRNTFVFSTDVGATLNDVSSPQYDFALGGFLNLSGLAPASLTGPDFGIARLIYYRQIGRGGNGVLNLPVYAGLSLEAGNVWRDRHDASLGDLKKDGSIFLGADTPLGPLYLGAGFAQGGDTAFYLFLGRTF